MYAGEGWRPTGRQWDLLMSLPSPEVLSALRVFPSSGRNVVGGDELALERCDSVVIYLADRLIGWLAGPGA